MFVVLKNIVCMDWHCLLAFLCFFNIAVSARHYHLPSTCQRHSPALLCVATWQNQRPAEMTSKGKYGPVSFGEWHSLLRKDKENNGQKYLEFHSVVIKNLYTCWTMIKKAHLLVPMDQSDTSRIEYVPYIYNPKRIFI